MLLLKKTAIFNIKKCERGCLRQGTQKGLPRLDDAEVIAVSEKRAKISSPFVARKGRAKSTFVRGQILNKSYKKLTRGGG